MESTVVAVLERRGRWLAHQCLRSVRMAANPPPNFTSVRTWLHRNRTVVLFVFMLGLLDVSIGQHAATWERHSPDDYDLRIAACRSQPRDLLFVGGSPVAEGIDPARIVGLTWDGRSLDSSYALGLSGGTTSDFYHALLRGCPTPPRVLVYGITASDINDARHEPHGPHSLMTWGDLARWVQLRPESAEWVIRHFVQSRLSKLSNLYRYRHGLKMWLAWHCEQHFPGACSEAAREAEDLLASAQAIQTGNGYHPAKGFQHMRYDAVKAAGAPQAPFPFLNRYRTGSHLKYLHRLIDWCEAHGVRFVLIDMPVTADLETQYAAAFAEYRSRLAAIESARGLTVFRATREATGLNDTHFADTIHLNCSGAQRFSDWLRTALATALEQPTP